jgi:hypothetical protein
MSRRNGFGFVGDDFLSGVTGGAGPYNPSGGSAGGRSISGGAVLLRDGAPHPDFAGCLYDSRMNDWACDDGYWLVSGRPVGEPSFRDSVSGSAGAYEPFGEVSGGAGAYRPAGENQTSWSQFFSGDRSLLGGGGAPKPTTNLTPYLLVGVVGLIALFALKK